MGRGGRVIGFVDSPEEAISVAQRATAEMEAHGVIPHPRNYDLWYAYCSGNLPDLNRAMDAAMAAGEPFTEARCAELHARFLSDADGDPRMLAASESVRQSVLRALEFVGAAHRGASDYGRTIGAVSQELEHVAEQEEIALVLTRALEETHRFADLSKSLAAHLAESQREIGQIRQHMDALRREGRSDSTTGLGNRRVFEIVLKEAALLAAHDRQPLSVILVRLDGFAAFVESHGVRLGDQVLRLIGRTLTECVRGRDTVCRYADDVFAVILPGTDLAQAHDAAEGIRLAVAQRTVVNRRTHFPLGQLTLSLGVAERGDGEDASGLVQRAEKALEAAEQGGRNRTVSAT